MCKLILQLANTLRFPIFLKIPKIQSRLVENKADILMIPPGCRSKCHPMDVCINKPFKAILRKCWVTYISKIIEQMPATTPDDFKLPPPSRQDMVVGSRRRTD